MATHLCFGCEAPKALNEMLLIFLLIISLTAVQSFMDLLKERKLVRRTGCLYSSIHELEMNEYNYFTKIIVSMKHLHLASVSHVPSYLEPRTQSSAQNIYKPPYPTFSNAKSV